MARDNPTNYIDRYLWEDAAKNNYTDKSYEDFARDCIDEQIECFYPWINADNSSTSFVTDSDMKKIKEALDEPEELVFSVNGGGRMFDSNYELDVCFEPRVLEIIREVENDDESQARTSLKRFNELRSELKKIKEE